MTKFVSGLVIGFFLAVALMAGYVQVYMGPHYETVKMAQPYAKALYNVAHSDAYTETQALVEKVKDAAAAVAQVPIIGSSFEQAKVTQYAQVAIETLQNAKASSEVMLTMVNMTLSLIEASVSALLFSIGAIIFGAWLYYKDEKAAKKGKR
jgi:hypothetical protein